MSGSVFEFHRIASIVIGAAVLAGLTFMSGRLDEDTRGTTQRRGSVVRNSRPLMGTTFHLSAWAPVGNAPRAAETLVEALDLIAALERQISSWHPDSETSAVNRAAGGDSIPIGAPLRELISSSLDWSRHTLGAFDVTGGPLFDLWAHARQQGELPSTDKIQRALQRVGHDKLVLFGNSVKLVSPRMRISFGAIGKGFVADRAAAFMRAKGLEDFIIDAGGDIVVGGSRGGTPWNVAIRHPRRDEFLAEFAATDCAIATSGDYEQFMTIDGKRYSHIIDPRTGWPASESISVTVIARRAVDADALATALSAMGPDKGLVVINELAGTEAIMARTDGSLILSPGLRLVGNRLELVP